MSDLVLETAAFADAVQRAARVAPTKGAAFDKAAGIVVSYDPTEPTFPVRVVATDLELTFATRLQALEAPEGARTWRLPATLLAGIANGLPLGSGQSVTFKEDAAGNVAFKAGRVRGKLAPILGDYPTVAEFDSADVSLVPDLSMRIAQVAWACASEVSVLAGIHFDGERIVATDRYKLVHVPCKVPIEKAITANIAPIVPLIQGRDVRIGATEQHLLLMPDDFTQVTGTLFNGEFPNWERALRDDFKAAITVEREAWLNSLQRVQVITKAERDPVVNVAIGGGTMKVGLSVKGVGQLIDELDVAGPDDPFAVTFNPSYLIDALNCATSDEIVFHYGPDARRIHLIEDPLTDLKAYVMPRVA